MTAVATAVPPVAAAASGPRPVAPIRVVVADDSAAIRTLLRYTLTPGRGFDLVGEAGNGAEALALTDSHSPDCVVLDIQMPEMGGLEALATLRESHPQMPVIMLSGFLNSATRATTRAAGASATLDKSTDLSLLPTMVRRLVCGTDDQLTVVAPAGTPPVSTLPGSVDPTVVGPVAVPASDRISDDSEVELRRLEYVVGHDLGEPVRIISGFTDLLRDRCAGDLDDSGKAFLDDISDAALRLQSMLDDLLTYGRAGRAEPALEEIDVRQLVQQVYEDLATTSFARGALMTVSDQATVIADPTMLKTVLTHVVVNALTFNVSAVPEVHVAARTRGSTTTIVVGDNGIGIRPEHCERVFDLFQRLNTREEYAGNGTGLALCRRLVSLQGGTIELSSSPAEGASLTIRLPTSRPPAITHAQEAS